MPPLPASRTCLRSSLLLLLVLLHPGPGEAAVRRCIAADGTMIYTDRPCDHFNAQDAAPPPEPEAIQRLTRPAYAPMPEADAELPLSAFGPVHSDCARTPDALLFTLRRVLEQRDINSLAGLYHWRGMGKYSATSVMDRLEAITRNSDGSADLIYPDAAFVVHNPQAYPDLPAENPIGVRLPVFHRGGLSQAAPEATTLRILRHAGCWWLAF